MLEIKTHHVTGVPEYVRIFPDGDKGQGGAHTKYLISLGVPGGRESGSQTALRFQNGSAQEVGPNGVTNEAVLAVVIDRLKGFQQGELSCRENAIALTHLETALLWLQQRTRDRIERGVEGKIKL